MPLHKGKRDMWETKFINIKQKKLAQAISAERIPFGRANHLTRLRDAFLRVRASYREISPLTLHKSSAIYISFLTVRDV